MIDHPDYVPYPADRVPRDGLVIEFPDNNLRDAGQLASDLKRAVENAMIDNSASAETAIAKVNPGAQDVGTILAIILGAKATIALAAGIAAWLRRKNQGRIRIRRPDGTSIDITNAESDDMEGIVRALSSSP